MHYPYLTVEGLDAYAYEDLVADSTAGGKGFTASKLEPTPSTSETGKQARSVLITVETAACRYTYDGTPPTTTLGHLAAIGDTIVIHGLMNLKRFRAIRTTGTSADLRVTFHR